MERLEALAACLAGRPGATAAQMALAWALHQGKDIVPIPGTKRRAYLEQNCAAADLALGPADLAELERIFPPGAAAGPRYPEAALKMVGR